MSIVLARATNSSSRSPGYVSIPTDKAVRRTRTSPPGGERCMNPPKTGSRTLTRSPRTSDADLRDAPAFSYGAERGDLNIAELTSRVSSADITVTLDRMAASFSEKYDSTAARKERSAARAAGQSLEYRDVNPYDAVLATSMLQVGVESY